MYKNKEQEKAKKRELYLKNKERNIAKQKAYYAANADKICQYQKDYRAKNKTELKDYKRNYYLENKENWVKSKCAKYGITPDIYYKMYADQQGKCLGCGKTETELNSSLCIDHCHTTNKVRGLLCGGCNKALGHVKDNPEVLTKLALYLTTQH